MNYFKYLVENGLMDESPHGLYIKTNTEVKDINPDQNTIIFKGDNYQESCIVLISSLEFLRKCGIKIDKDKLYYDGNNYYVNTVINAQTIHYMIAMQATLEMLISQMAGSNISYLRDGLLFCQGEI